MTQKEFMKQIFKRSMQKALERKDMNFFQDAVIEEILNVGYFVPVKLGETVCIKKEDYKVSFIAIENNDIVFEAKRKDGKAYAFTLADLGDTVFVK